jgi:ATP-dependent Clp protease adapter protein ClpS
MVDVTKKDTDKNTNTATDKERTWQSILFNCDCHSIDDVVLRLQQAIGCSEEQAFQYATTAEKFGCVTYFTGSQEECNKVAKPLAAIALDVVVEPQ